MFEFSREEVLEWLVNFDKRSVCFTDEDKARVLRNPNLQDRLAGFVSFAEEIIGEPMYSLPFSSFKLFSKNGDRSAYESMNTTGYFAHRKQMCIFGVLSWLVGEERYIEKLEDAIFAVLDEYTWCLPAHITGGRSLSRLESGQYTIDLFASETGSALAELIALLGDKISPIIVERAKYELDRRIVSRATESFGWNTTMTNNWATVCAGNVLLAASYLVKDNERLADIIMTCLASARNYLGAFESDGACLEGVSYWNYGFSGFVLLADTLKKCTDGKIDLYKEEKVKSIATFISKCSLPGGRSVSFSDGSSMSKKPLPILSKLASIYPDIVALDSGCVVPAAPRSGTFDFCAHLRQFLYCTYKDVSKINVAYGTHILPDAKWYISTSESGVSLCAKSGFNNESHNHNDVGSFQIFKNGEQLLLDIGAGDYCGSYFSPKRYSEHYCCCSRGHSVPIINGVYQHQGTRFASRDTFITEDGISADIAGAYDLPELKGLKRELRFDKAESKIYLSDVFSFDEKPMSVVERFIVGSDAEIGDGCATVTVGEEKCRILFDKTRVVAKSGRLERVNSSGSTSSHSYLDLEIIDPAESFDVEIVFVL